MLKLTYDPLGQAVADLDAPQVAFNLADMGCYTDVEAVFSTSNVFEHLRLLIAKGELDHTLVEYHFEGQVLRPDCLGYVPDHPRGFCDWNYRLSVEVLRTIGRRKGVKDE